MLAHRAIQRDHVLGSLKKALLECNLSAFACVGSLEGAFDGNDTTIARDLPRDPGIGMGHHVIDGFPPGCLGLGIQRAAQGDSFRHRLRLKRSSHFCELDSLQGGVKFGTGVTAQIGHLAAAGQFAAQQCCAKILERRIAIFKGVVADDIADQLRRIALEMHPNFVVYNPRTLLRLREAAGEEIGANCDLSHLFWQQCNAVEVIRFLGKQGAIYHAHMKDTAFFPHNVDRFGVLNFGKKDDHEASEFFRAVGYGHGASAWKDIIAAYMEVGYNGMLSIENEDPILSGEVGVQRSLAVLKNVREELLTSQPNPG